MINDKTSDFIIEWIFNNTESFTIKLVLVIVIIILIYNFISKHSSHSKIVSSYKDLEGSLKNCVNDSKIKIEELEAKYSSLYAELHIQKNITIILRTKLSSLLSPEEYKSLDAEIEKYRSSK